MVWLLLKEIFSLQVNSHVLTTLSNEQMASSNIQSNEKKTSSYIQSNEQMTGIQLSSTEQMIMMKETINSQLFSDEQMTTAHQPPSTRQTINFQTSEHQTTTNSTIEGSFFTSYYFLTNETITDNTRLILSTETLNGASKDHISFLYFVTGILGLLLVLALISIFLFHLKLYRCKTHSLNSRIYEGPNIEMVSYEQTFEFQNNTDL